MRQLLLLFSIALLSASCNHAKENTSTEAKDIEEIKKVLDRQNQDWNRGDIDAFMVGYWETDSLMFVGKSGVTYGYKNTLANYKKNYPDTTAMGKLSFTYIDFKKLSDEYYQLTGKYYLTRSVGDASGHYTLLVRKLNGKWVIVYDHSS
jgi:hypothetical protein